MKKYRAWVNLFLISCIMINGFWLNTFSAFMALCAIFLFFNNVGVLTYDN